MAIPAVLVAGISKGGFGSGAAFAAAPFLALILDPVQAVALMLPLLMVIDAGALRAWWGQWDRAATRVLVIGGIAGTFLGMLVFSTLSSDVLRVLIGCIALGFVGFQVARGRGLIGQTAAPGLRAGLFWGTLAGLTSFVSHAGGPPATVFLLGRGLSKAVYQATTVIVFAILNVLKCVIYAGMGLFDGTALVAVLTLAPVALLGTWLGVHAHRQIPERIFFLLVYLFLTVTGVKLIWDAMT